MPVVPAGFTVPWQGATAIPAGWERETALDGRHPQGAATGADPGIATGADTHVHTSNHGHTGSSHQHTGGTSAGGTTAEVYGGAVNNIFASAGHTHSIPTTGLATHSLTAGAAAFGATNSDPTFL